MRDAAAHRDAAQARKQRIGRTPHMQDHRQAGLARQLQLGPVEVLLPRQVQPRHEVVQPDLAHRHQPRVVSVRAQLLLQVLQIALGGALHVQRMDAQCISALAIVSQFPHPVEVGALHRRQHQPRHASGTRAFDHGVTVSVELRRIQMAMGVDPATHAGDLPCAARRSSIASPPGRHWSCRS